MAHGAEHPWKLQQPGELAMLPLVFNPFYGTFLFLGGPVGSYLGGHPWLEHHAALLLLGAFGLGFSGLRLSRARD